MELWEKGSLLAGCARVLVPWLLLKSRDKEIVNLSLAVVCLYLHTLIRPVMH